MRRQAADQGALVGAAGQQQARRREVPQGLEHRLVERAGGAAGPPGDHQVQAGVVGLGQERLEGVDGEPCWVATRS